MFRKDKQGTKSQLNMQTVAF